MNVAYQHFIVITPAILTSFFYIYTVVVLHYIRENLFIEKRRRRRHGKKNYFNFKPKSFCGWFWVVFWNKENLKFYPFLCALCESLQFSTLKKTQLIVFAIFASTSSSSSCNVMCGLWYIDFSRYIYIEIIQGLERTTNHHFSHTP